MASTSSSTPISNQAARTVRKINDSLYELYKPATGSIDVEILFFHGLQARDYSEAYLKTWMLADDSECWLNTWFAQEFPQARILSVTYDSSTHVSDSTGRMDMYTLGENLAHSLIGLAGIGQSCAVVLVGHCIGGLVLKQLCLQADQMGAMDMGPGHNPYKTFLANMKRAFFYSTPNVGSRAVLNAKPKGPLLQYLELLSKDAARLNSSFAKLRQQHGWKTCGVVESNETEASRSIIRMQNPISGFFNWSQHSLEVEEGSARHDMDDFRIQSGEDNFSICRPRDRSSSNYQWLVKFVQEVLQIEEFVKYNWRSTLLMPSKFVDMVKRVERVIGALALSSRLALIGMGGVGKTTLAKAVLIQIRAYFDFSCFVGDVKGHLKTRNKSLDNLVAENLFLGTGRKVHLHDRGAESLWSYLLGKKVLLIMDDVDSEDQISSLLSSSWLGKGSRVLITSRIRSRARMPTFHMHEVQLLSDKESEDLFLAHLDADVVRRVPKDLVAKVVQMCDGLPLTLEVIGGYLRFERDVRFWTSALDKLTKAESVDGSENDRLWAKLRVSLDELAEPERKLFLDIAVFGDIDLDTWRAAWETGADGSSVDVDLRNLADRSLIKLQNARHESHFEIYVTMHQQLRDLGKRLSRPPSDKIELGRACWRQEDVLYLLSQYKGNEAHTEIVSAYLDRITRPLACQRSYLWSGIGRLQELRLLRLSNVIMRGDESHRFPSKLRYLHLTSCFKVPDNKFKFLENWKFLSNWHCWPIREEDVEWLQQLSVLRLDSCSSVRLPSNFHKLKNLKVLIIKRTSMKDLPNNFGRLPGLKTLILEDVPISQLPSSFVQLSTLRYLTLKGCSLTAAMKGVVPQLARRGAKDPRPLQSLTKLRLVDLPGLTKLPRTFGLLESLKDLEIRGCFVLKELPDSLGQLIKLERLDVHCCSRLESLPDSLGQLNMLRFLLIRYCSCLESLPISLGQLSKLTWLIVHCCPRLESLPDSLGQLSKLTRLNVHCCPRLESLPDSLGQLSKLTCLNLHWFPLFSPPLESLESLESLFDSLRQLRNLMRLDMNRLVNVNSFTCLPDSLGQLSSLRYIQLYKCPFLESLSDSLGHISTLESLTLFNCPRLEKLPDSLGHISTLESLTLFNCPRLEKLPDSLGQLSSLRVMTVCMCPRLESLPGSLGHISTLESLTLFNCPRLEKLPDSLGQLSSLRVMKVCMCPRLESLPDSLGQISTLQKLKLWNCENLQRFPDSLLETLHLDISRCDRLETLQNINRQLEDISLVSKQSLERP